MTNIGELAYKVKFDARELQSGVQSARKATKLYKEIMEQTAPPLRKYTDGLENLRMMVARYPKLLQHQSVLQRQLEQDYLRNEAAVRKLTKAESDRQRKIDPAIARGENMAAGKKRQAMFRQIDADSQAARKALDQRLKVFKREKEAENKRLADLEKIAARERQIAQQRRNELLRLSGEGPRRADQRRIEAEAAAVRESRKELAKRLQVFKAERAAEKQRIAEQREFYTKRNQLAGQARQRFFQNIRAEQAAGRQALAERLALYKKEKRAEEKRAMDMQKAREKAAAARRREMAQERAARVRGGVGGVGQLLTFGLGGSAAFAGFDLVRQSIKTRAEIERSTAAFEVFTGSVAEANRMMDDFRELSSLSGISFDAIQSGAATYLSFGGAVENTMPALRQMAEITRGDAERFRSMSLAYAQVAAAGKLMGQELIQLVNAGFNPLKQISETTGKSMQDLRKDMENGLISFDMVKEAFRSATAEGGRYNGMMEKIAETTAGSLARMQAKFEIFKDKLGESLSDVTVSFGSNIESLLDQLTLWLSDFEESVDKRTKNATAEARRNNNAVTMDNFDLLKTIGAMWMGGTYAGAQRTDASVAASRANQLEDERRNSEFTKRDQAMKEQAEKERLAAEKKKARIEKKNAEELEKAHETFKGIYEALKKQYMQLNRLTPPAMQLGDFLGGLNKKAIEGIAALANMIPFAPQQEQARRFAPNALRGSQEAYRIGAEHRLDPGTQQQINLQKQQLNAANAQAQATADLAQVMADVRDKLPEFETV